MKNKKYKKIVLVLLVMQIMQLTAIASTNTENIFLDIDTSNKNYEAITFLKEKNIINGYNDNTFRADKTISRAEFLKLIIESTGKKLKQSKESPFTDIKPDAWYAPYAYTAKENQWINGYKDGSFKPNDKITKVEALKIISKVKAWDLNEKFHSTDFIDLKEGSWYIPYVQYANYHKFLEEDTEYFSPNDYITRAGVAEVLFRNIKDDNNHKEPKETEEDIKAEKENVRTPPTIKKLDFIPVSEQKISKSYFEDITLTESIPNTFYVNEIYEISGKTKSNKTATIFINKGSSNKNQEVFRQTNDSKNFKLPVYFKNPGNFKIGIIDGESGTSKVKNISVIELPENNNIKKTETEITSSEISFKNDATLIKFKTTDKTNKYNFIKKISFKQDDNIVTYITRQNKNQITLNFKDFQKFNTNQITYNIEFAKLKNIFPLEFSSKYKTTEDKTFIPTKHNFQKLSKNKISTTIPEKLKIKKKIVFTGKSTVKIKKDAYIIKPDGFVDTVELITKTEKDNKDTIDANTKFTFEYIPQESNTYIIEITDENGLPLINTPIYIGDEVPLLPNYFDSNERIFFDNKMELTKMREEMLKYINESRKKHKLDAITMDTELNNLAQSHSKDMASHNFFAHINKKNETPEDRRKKTAIKTPVSENIAKDVSIEFAHKGLMRSATHRENILSKGWDKVGIGIATTDGYLLVTEEFTSNEVDAKDLLAMRESLLKEINIKRAQNSIDAMNEMEDLNYVATKVNKLTELDTLTSDSFKEILNEKNIKSTTQAIGRVFFSWDEILESIIDDETELFTNKWVNIGIAIEKDSEANIVTTIIITE